MNLSYVKHDQITIEGRANTFHFPSQPFTILGLGGFVKLGLSNCEQIAAFFCCFKPEHKPKNT